MNSLEEIGRFRYAETRGMEFKDLKIFNQTLLAKQCWRLPYDTGSLVHRVLKAKYFPKGEFIDAARGGTQVSHGGVRGGGSPLKEGLNWRIGNGRKVLAWEDNWFSSNVVM